MTDEIDTTDTDGKKQASVIDELEKLVGAAETPAKPNPKALAFTEQIPPRDYDVPVVENFLDKVFHSGLDNDHVLTWLVAPTSSPAFPRSEEFLINELNTTKSPKALYFGTATCKRADDGKLYNRKALFSALHVVVLDDIGTKVSKDKIPAAFIPSYILETSKDNFQYGYVLAEPVEDLAAAEALIQLVYESGCSDEGGKMPNKLVRMPEGVNGKQGKGGFVSRLTADNDVVYTPQEILDALNLNTEWAEVLKDADSVTKKRASRSIGATPWATITPQAASLSGIIDPVLEWLYETDQVLMDNGGEWIKIICPWCAEHTQQNEVDAGYIPLGRGDKVDERAFNCFHDSCTSNKTDEFLKYVAATSGIEVGRHDPAAALTTRYVFDQSENAAWDIKADNRETKIMMASFANLYPHQTTVYTTEGKPRKVGMTSLWKTAASRVTVVGATYDPSTTARLVEHRNALYVNLFSIPEWGHGPIDMTHVEKFQAYLDYLIPDDEQRAYFLHWLSAKVQDMSFRGAAIVMVANQQGIGRGTLADMIKTLIGESNTAGIPLKDILGDNTYNTWQEKPFVMVEETLAGDKKDFYSNYEKLKTLVDPRGVSVLINPKYGVQRTVQTHSSFLFMSNHANALALPAEDRRFYVINNAITPADPQYFMDVDAWVKELDVDGMPVWGRHVFRWLSSLPVDLVKLLAPPPKTAGKAEMANAALSNLDYALTVILEEWPISYMTANDAYAVFRHPLLQGPLHFDEDTNVKFIKTRVNAATSPYRDKSKKPMKVKVDGKSVYPRALNTRLADGSAVALDDATAYEEVSKAVRASGVDLDLLANHVHDQLEADGRI